MVSKGAGTHAETGSDLICGGNVRLDQLEDIWYEGFENDGRTRHDHYNKSRYYALNLHSVFYRGTVEWRCFNSTLDPAKAAAYVHLCLAMSAQAIVQRSAVMQKTRSDNELFTFRVWRSAWASTATSSRRPEISFSLTLTATGRGATTRTATRSTEGKNDTMKMRGDFK